MFSLRYPNEEAIQDPTVWMRRLISLRRALRLCRFCFDPAHDFVFYWIDDFIAKTVLLQSYRAVSLECLRRNGEPVKSVQQKYK